MNVKRFRAEIDIHSFADTLYLCSNFYLSSTDWRASDDAQIDDPTDLIDAISGNDRMTLALHA